jgi:hypothetical protein
MNYRSTSIGTGGSNWLRTMIPDAAGGGVESRAVAAGDEGVGGLATPELAGTAADGLATPVEVGPVAVWSEQAPQNPNKIATAAFFI